MSVQCLEIVKRTGIENDPQKALLQLLEDCIAQTGATTGRLYLLSLSNTAYVQLTSPDHSVRNPPQISLLNNKHELDDSLLRRVIGRRMVERVAEVREQPIGRENAPSAISRLLVPIVRDRVCLGVIDLDSEHPGHFTKEHEETIQVASVVAVLLCEKEDTLQLLKELPRPIDYHQPFDEFLDDIMILIATASRMPCIALHELRDDVLYCLKSYGFSEISEEELHISPIDDYQSFQEAVEDKEPVIENHVDQEHVRLLLESLKLQQVQSFIVVPVLVGKVIFGTLLFAVSSEHEYTTLEKSGLVTIANAVGVAIANYQNFHTAEERLFEMATVSAAITTVDVAQSARHEARNHLQNAQDILLLFQKGVVDTLSRQKDQARRWIHSMSQELFDLNNALQKIKTITKPPEREKTLQCLEELWDEAFSLALGRMEHQRIRYNIRGAATTKVAVDYIRHAFLNLIMNSIDSLKESKKQGRSIEVTIDPQSERAKDIVMRYVDNGQGIDPSKLRPSLDEGVRPVTDIFLAGISSKPGGSGHGLYLVRKIFTDHNGSIDLKEYRNGVVFEMKLPKLG